MSAFATGEQGERGEHGGPDEVRLTGGNATGALVRSGDTVRKPWLAQTERTAAYQNGLRRKGIDVPRHLGRDALGRQVVEYVPGELAIDRAPLDDAAVHRVGRLIRTIHDASADLLVPDDWPVLLPADGADLICHNDLATWNLIIDGERLVFIDWDGAGPSTVLWDLAYAAISFAHLFPDAAVDASADRLAEFLAGYRADESLRKALPETMIRRSAAMHDLLARAHGTGGQPWADMYVEGHGEHWQATTEFIARHQRAWVQACDRGLTA